MMGPIMQLSRYQLRLVPPPAGDPLLHHVLDVAAEVYLYDRLEERYLSVNSRCLDVLGYAPEEILRMRPRDLDQLIHPKDLARVKRRPIASGTSTAITGCCAVDRRCFSGRRKVSPNVSSAWRPTLRVRQNGRGKSRAFEWKFTASGDRNVTASPLSCTIQPFRKWWTRASC
jgi:PAS domain-containing protein